MDDARQLYEKFLAGDPAQLALLVERLGNPLLLFINSYVHDLATAEDLMEDCFVQLLVSRPQFHGQSQFKTFLFQIGKNKALNYLRRKQHFIWVNTDTAEAELGEDAGILQELELNERNQALYRAMRVLPADYRRAVLLIYFEELSYEECAKVMGKTRKQIDNYLYRAKKQLATLLGEEAPL
ncbi:MAG: RNA polymerase sigma factor [Clostridiaceae bacterium]|nr:RNA polymerase sigma factor [Clostridiaceae bacterium]